MKKLIIEFTPQLVASDLRETTQVQVAAAIDRYFDEYDVMPDEASMFTGFGLGTGGDVQTQDGTSTAV